ncbi:MAG: bifunctional hydroxymethylpyrimidine kinase/phosphomethylpyrimidine kinase [Bacillota bacterium]|nr:bifunctional hydroxymethylpyrimidine kinase/phosphomethylpyrimidine kinase [Bacillota bacterium]
MSYHADRPVRCLTIAGSDSSGGAGIQADLKTFAAHGVYGMSVVTAITAQNTCGVTAVHDIPVDVAAAQLDAVFQDIRPDAVKISMVSNPELIQAIADRLRAYRPRVIVLDPVMVSTSGCSLISDGALEKLASELIPIATLITPNIPEAEILLGRSIAPAEQIEAALALFDRFQVPVLLKGGHFEGEKVDVLADRSGIECFALPSVDNPNTHGTGCTLSSAIASGCALAMRGFFVRFEDALPDGDVLRSVIREAKRYVSLAISRRLDIGEGRGPLDHMGYR